MIGRPEAGLRMLLEGKYVALDIELPASEPEPASLSASAAPESIEIRKTEQIKTEETCLG